MARISCKKINYFFFYSNSNNNHNDVSCYTWPDGNPPPLWSCGLHIIGDTSTPFLLCIHLIYSLSFQSIFNDFAVPVCLLLLIVVVLYFVCILFILSKC